MEAGALSWADFETAGRYWAENSARVRASRAGQLLPWAWEWKWRAAAGPQAALPGQGGFLELRPVARRVVLAGTIEAGARGAEAWPPDEPAAEEEAVEEEDGCSLGGAAAAELPPQGGGGGLAEWAEFAFHVLWSSAFGVPVVYFTASFADGAPLVPAAVSRAFSQGGADGGDGGGSGGGGVGGGSGEPLAESWTFLTQEEHPVLGTPAFMFHPCQTAERLACLAAPPRAGAGATGAGASGMHARGYLLAWFAMMAPTLRLELPPAAYLALHEALLPAVEAAGSSSSSSSSSSRTNIVGS
jgi:hypothetical protein